MPKNKGKRNANITLYGYDNIQAFLLEISVRVFRYARTVRPK